jgi:hypothetical protein
VMRFSVSEHGTWRSISTNRIQIHDRASGGTDC